MCKADNGSRGASRTADGKARFAVVLACGALLFSAGRPAHALTFDFVAPAGTPQNVRDAFAVAGQQWSALFADPVTVRIGVDWVDFTADPVRPNGALAGSSQTRGIVQYADVRTALTNDATSPEDTHKVGFLQTGPGYDRVVNYTADNPNGIGSATSYLDNDGFFDRDVLITSANAKALGLTPDFGGGSAPSQDGAITVNSSFTWDFDPSDGIAAGSYDFVGNAQHEIGHILGFDSFVDRADLLLIPCNGNLLTCSNLFTYDGNNYVQAADGDSVAASHFTPAVMDLFRFSAMFGNLPDISLDDRDKYFPLLDGSQALFANGVGLDVTISVANDQASHWRDNSGLGLMDPDIAAGVLQSISEVDVELFDAIGWTRQTTIPPPPAVPEPSTLLLLGSGLLGLAARGRRGDAE